MEMEAPARELLSQTNIGNLGFHGLDGYPRVIPVWFNFTRDEIQVASPPGAYKIRCLRADPRAVLTVSTSATPFRVVSATGQVEIDVIEEPERIRFVTDIATRYLGLDGGRAYIESWARGGPPGPGDLIRLAILRVRYTRVYGE